MKKRSRKKRASRKESVSILSPVFKALYFSFINVLKFIRFLWASLPGKLKRRIASGLFSFLALAFFLSFIGEAGKIGDTVKDLSLSFFGYSSYLLPVLLLAFSLCLLFVPKNFLASLFLGLIFSLLGTSGMIGVLGGDEEMTGILVFPLVERLISFLGPVLSFFVFFVFSVLGFSAFWYFLSEKIYQKRESPSIIWRGVKTLIFSPKVKVSSVSDKPQVLEGKEEPVRETVSLEKTKKALKHPGPLPPLDLLEEKETLPQVLGDVKENMEIIKETLENFGIEVTMGQVNIGPTVSQYTLRPAKGVRLSKIVSLANNLSLALAAHPIRIEAPIPGKSLVGIEVPNKKRGIVRLGPLLSSPDFQTAESLLTFALGKTVDGQDVFESLEKLPHLLVAGATGSGKTIFLNTLIVSLLFKNTPETLRFLLIDPKRVEFSFYQELPHLLAPVVLDVDRAVMALSWLVSEMERRFELMREEKVKDIKGYNLKARNEKRELLPYLVVIIDELADLMASKGKEIEAYIVRLAQMARAVGIHLVIATQRPSVEVLTGLIKANITARISFQVATQFDSRTILDTSGAEKLLGAGDMLYISPRRPKPQRLQGAYISENEIERVVSWVKEKVSPGTDEIALNFEVDEEQDSLPDDPLYDSAKEIVVREGKASASLLQRKLKIGYNRAARLLDMLEERGIVGPERGSKPREVYLKPEDIGLS